MGAELAHPLLLRGDGAGEVDEDELVIEQVGELVEVALGLPAGLLQGQVVDVVLDGAGGRH
jgi:hypothetical protein